MTSYDRGWDNGFSTGAMLTLFGLGIAFALFMMSINPGFVVETENCETTYTFDRSWGETEGVTIDKYCKENK